MTKAVYAIFFFFFLVCLTFTLSFKAFAQDSHFTFSYMSFFKQAVLNVKPTPGTVTPTPKQVLGISTKPTVKPTVSPTPQPTSVPTASLGSISDYLLTKVNQYRATQGLPSVQSSAEVCTFATIRAQEIAKSFTHAGFNTRVANHTIPYAHWTRATENIAETADYKQVVDLWINSPEHAANMRDNTPYVCVAQSGNDYAYEGMRP